MILTACGKLQLPIGALTKLLRYELELGSSTYKRVGHSLKVRAVRGLRAVQIFDDGDDELRQGHFRRLSGNRLYGTQVCADSKKPSCQLDDGILFQMVSHDNSIYSRHIFVDHLCYPAMTGNVWSARHQKADGFAREGML